MSQDELHTSNRLELLLLCSDAKTGSVALDYQQIIISNYKYRHVILNRFELEITILLKVILMDIQSNRTANSMYILR